MDAQGVGRAGIVLGRVSTTEALVHAMTSQILDGTLAPGTHLREIELAERHGVSRHSIRAAMAELVHHGMLRRHPHRGYWVPVLTVEDVRDLFLMRGMIEGEAVRRLMLQPRTLSDVEFAVAELEALRGDEPWRSTVERHLAVHRAIVAAVGSPRLSRAHFYLETEFRLSHALAGPRWRLPTLRQAHRELLTLLQRGDPGAALAFVQEDIATGLRSVLDFLQPSGEPDAVTPRPDS
jgi:DNA-binding GntR family transcriptional regulator